MNRSTKLFVVGAVLLLIVLLVSVGIVGKKTVGMNELAFLGLLVVAGLTFAIPNHRSNK
jgi:hypothetical protein